MTSTPCSKLEKSLSSSRRISLKKKVVTMTAFTKRGLRAMIVALALSTIQVTVRFGSVHPNLDGEHSGGGQRPPTSLPLPPTTREDLQLDGYLEYPHAVKALYIYKQPYLLRDSNPLLRHSSQRR
ncbi:hypothetical protein TNCV_49901 [Trichonephila clavipes]|nr:hypothetical protein TNCV_49901 [Trichonephila clavipes]